MNPLKTILLLGILLVPLLEYSQSNPFKDIAYDKVIAFEFHQEGTDDFKLKDVIEKKKVLTKKQIRKLEAIVTSRASYGSTNMACFIPHFQVIYYLREKPVAGIKVCLECNYLKSTVRIPAIYSHTVINEEGNTYLKKGFSKRARGALKDYLTKIGFTKYIPPHDSYLD